jgi:hypothetical protein
MQLAGRYGLSGPDLYVDLTDLGPARLAPGDVQQNAPLTAGQHALRARPAE